MFYINQTGPAFDQAKQAHFTNIRYVIKKKLLGHRFREPHPAGTAQRINKAHHITANVAHFLSDEAVLKKLLIGTPDILDTLKNRFTRKKDIGSIRSLFNYDSFISKEPDSTYRFYNGYDLAENLNQPTCVYCNRLYTHTIISQQRELITRPAFDHWFPKVQFPLLALSFYNLIPSCTVCNSQVKGATALSLADQFHPYLKHPQVHRQLNFRFSYDLEDHLRAKHKIVQRNAFSSNSLKQLKLADLYSGHAEEIRELIYLKKAYSDAYLDSLRTILKTPVSANEIYRLAFGVYYEDDLLHKRPLSKLKKDILKELGMI